MPWTFRCLDCRQSITEHRKHGEGYDIGVGICLDCSERAVRAWDGLVEKQFKRGGKVSKLTARKFNGDDRCSWAIFSEGQAEPIVSGLSRSEVTYYKKLIEKEMKDGKLPNQRNVAQGVKHQDGGGSPQEGVADGKLKRGDQG